MNEVKVGNILPQIVTKQIKLNVVCDAKFKKWRVQKIKKNTKKSIKRNQKCFFEVENNDNLLIYKKVKERLVNNIKNLFDSKRKINILNLEILLIDEIYENYEIDFTIRDLQKLAIIEPELIIENIRELAHNFELSSIEIEEIAKELNIDFSNIIEIDLALQFKNLKKAANNQLYLIFDEELKVS